MSSARCTKRPQRTFYVKKNIMKDNFEEKDNRIIFSFAEEERNWDEVETLCFILGENNIYPVGEAYTQLDGTCPSLWYSMYSGLVFIIDLVHDCEKLKHGETITIEGKNPTADQMDLIRREEWYSEED